MQLNERQRQILDIVCRDKFVTVQGLCGLIFASPATIRRDLCVLEENKSIKRVYGGAIPISGNDQEIPHDIRLYRNIAEKKSIAQTAVKLVSNASTIILDSSTTCTYLVRQLDQFKDLSVLTNGMDSLALLTNMSGIKTIATGGIITSGYELRGAFTQASIERYSADLFFLSCCSVSVETGVTFTDEDNASIKQLMAKHARKKVLLCDSSKFNRSHFFRAFSLDEFDYIITDTAPKNKELRDAMGEHLICADDSHIL
jgi:DeoR/GlpR family transcriptional regulator of sugar metabolism